MPPLQRTRTAPIEGLLLVDKPAGVTSHDVVQMARRALGVRRIGHAGTLDPFATGLLVLLVGRVTRLLPYLDGEPKEYVATIRFGAETDSDDLMGETVREAGAPGIDAVATAIHHLTGAIEQMPPAYSAKSVGGERSYDAARRGERLDLKAVRVTVHSWQIHSFKDADLRVTIVCSGGTYIRALARDAGRLAGSAAHLVELRRTRSGPFSVLEATPVTELTRETAAVMNPLPGLSSMTRVDLSDDELIQIRQGRAIAGEGAQASVTVAATMPAVADERTPAEDSGPGFTGDGERAVLVTRSGEIAGIALRAGSYWKPKVVLADG